MIDPRALAELDAWVAEEVAAIRAPSRPRDANVADANRWTSERVETEAANEDAAPDETAFEDAPAAIPPARPDDEGALGYDAEEEAFMEATAQWLAGRANADILLEEIWRRIGEPSADSEDVVVPINLPQAEAEADWPDAEADGDFGDAADDGADDGADEGAGPEGAPEDGPEDGHG